MKKPILAPESTLLLRVPLLPKEAVESILCHRWQSTEVVNSQCLNEAITNDLQFMQMWLQTMLASSSPYGPLIQEALLVGSLDLSKALPQLWQASLDDKKCRAIAIKTFRYILRMATRPTPFGLFAGVALGKVSLETQVNRTIVRKQTRVDMQWLLSLVHFLEQLPPLADQLHWYPNPLLLRNEMRYFLSYTQKAEQISFRSTPVVDSILKFASSGQTRQQIKSQLIFTFPDEEPANLVQQVNDLCMIDALYSELRPALTTLEDPLWQVIKHLESLPETSQLRTLRGDLQGVLRKCSIYDATFPLGQGKEYLQQVLEEKPITSFPQPLLLQTDLGMECTTATLSSQVANEAGRAAELLVQLSPHPTIPVELQLYQQMFFDLYPAREVPLLELLDEYSGLGPPPSYQYPPRAHPIPLPAQADMTKREQRLFSLASNAINRHQHEICLSDEQIASLRNIDWHLRLPSSLDLFVSIVSPSRQALDKGDYLICVGPRGGAAPMGRSFGRFCHLLGEKGTLFLSRLAQEEEQNEPEKIFAELVFLPFHEHTTNVTLRPAIRAYEVAIGTSLSHTATSLPLEDLLVGVRGDHFYLRDRKSDKEVVICNGHLLNLSYQAPNIVRFLAAIAGRQTPHLRFDWGKSSTLLPFLPRLRYQHIVLSPAQWLFPLAHPSSQAELYHSSIKWYRYVQAWRKEWRVPRHVYYLDQEQLLLLDLENPLCCLDLQQICRKRDRSVVLIQEALPGLEHEWAKGEQGTYYCEWVVPLKAITPHRNQSSSISFPLREQARERACLGSGWSYVKLYCREESQQHLLFQLKGFVEFILQSGMVVCWFFVRYRDPQPHIRLRFRSSNGKQALQLLPPLLEWLQHLLKMKWISHYVFDAYERETARYGGKDGIELAETLFTIDSKLVLDMLSLSTQGSFTSEEIGLLSVDWLLSNLLGTDERLHEKFYQSALQSIAGEQKRELHILYHMHQRRLMQLQERNWLLKQLDGEALLAPLDEAASSVQAVANRLSILSPAQLSGFLHSLVHMHCNRLLGKSTEEQRILYYLARLSSAKRNKKEANGNDQCPLA